MEYKKIGELFSYVSRGKSPKYVDNSDICIINQACIRWDGVDYAKIKYQDASSYREDTCLHDGDIVLTSTGTGTLGRCCVFHRPDQRVYVADSHVTVLRGAVGILPDILCLYLRTQRGQNKLYAECVNGSTNQIELSKEKLRLFVIPVPTMTTQRALVSQTTHINKIIELRKTELFELDSLVKARFVEMFGEPVSNPMGWERVPLSVCVESIDNGKSFVCDSAARKGDWPAVLKLSAATYGFYRPEENKAMLDENQFIEDAAVRVGDLLFTRKNTPELVGMCAYVYDTPSKLMMPDLIFRLNTTERCNKVFLWKLINHDLFRDCIQAIATGSAKSMSNISKERLLGLEISLPPIELQNQFAAFVEQTDKSKAAVQKALDEAQTLFDSLMQQYFG